jgi:hypothetical protein
MGNETVTEISPKEWGEHNYRLNGFRAVVKDGIRGFVDMTNPTWFKSLVDSLLHEKFWYALRAAEISDTWKERHAKGTPVKMSLAEFNECADNGFIYPIVRDFNNGNPIARVEFPGSEKTVATFCNFRYKEKGGKGAS